MPIYTARLPSGQMKPSPLLQSRGIELRSSTPTSIAAVGFAHYKQFAYSTYITNITAFIQAQVTGQKISTIKAFHDVVIQLSDQIPIPSPTVVIRFRSTITAEEEQAFQKLGGEVAMVGKGGKEQLLRFRTFNTETLVRVLAIKKDVIKNCQALFGQCNLDGYKAFLKAMSIATGFVRTQYYPAFSGPATRPPPINAFDTFEGFLSMKRSVVEVPKESKRGRLEEVEEGMEVDESEKEYDVEYTLNQFYDVPTASPPAIAVPGFGPASSVPTTTGNVFPYFQSLLEDDPTYVGTVCAQYFLTAFGDDAAENTKRFRQFRSDIGSIGQSETGHILNHIFMGIKLAIEVQGQLFLIIQSGVYKGFSLHGYYYTLDVGGQVFAPNSTEVVQQEVLEIDEHAIALAKILTVLGKSSKGKGKEKVKKVKAVDFDKPRKLRSFIKKFSLTDEELQEIDELSGGLLFPQTYWRYTVDNILRAVELLVNEEEPDESLPMYTAGGLLTTEQVELSIFALFGDYGFSFIVPQGSGFKLPKTAEEDTLYKPYKDPKSKKMKTPSKNLVIAKKEIRNCRSDWLTFRSNNVLVTREQRSSQFRSELFTGAYARELWFGLIKAIPAIEDTTEAVVLPEVKAGGKRRRDEDSDDELDFSAFL